ncbi:MAG: response regulator [Anaerotignum sp.]
MTRVIIVEDDPMVASINKKYLEKMSDVQVVGVFRNAKAAAEFLRQAKADLILLDYYMPEMSGLEFLHSLRKEKNEIDVIMVTAANDLSSIQSAITLGILDYLVKPFEYERFEAAIRKFQMKHKLLERNREFSQAEIDDLIHLQEPSATSGCPKIYEKGIQEATLKILTDCIRKAYPQTATCGELAEKTHLSKVTVRRYMNYMVENNQAESIIDYETGGRPSVQYKYKKI